MLLLQLRHSIWQPCLECCQENTWSMLWLARSLQLLRVLFSLLLWEASVSFFSFSISSHDFRSPSFLANCSTFFTRKLQMTFATMQGSSLLSLWVSPFTTWFLDICPTRCGALSAKKFLASIESASFSACCDRRWAILTRPPREPSRRCLTQMSSICELAWELKLPCGWCLEVRRVSLLLILCL